MVRWAADIRTSRIEPMMVRASCVACFAAGLFASAAALAQQNPDLVSHAELRVCADPHNLPFSNDKGEGYENKVAELVAHDLNLHVSYTWFPDSQGFVRATLMKNRCDVIMGAVAGEENLSTTDAYMHTGYMLVTRLSDKIATDQVSNWQIAGKRFGLIASTPPTDLIVQHNLMDQTAIYQLMVDTRIDQPSHDMLMDLVAGKIDVALLWGPFAGYYTKHDHLPLKLVFLNPEDSKVRLDYHIAMGVRPADVDFRRRLNRVIAKDQPEITKILQDYGIPLLDEQDRPVAPG
jgi:quinoprotein dehydrogenase-associated probable ABC transporter substrate-binding protein